MKIIKCRKCLIEKEECEFRPHNKKNRICKNCQSIMSCEYSIKRLQKKLNLLAKNAPPKPKPQTISKNQKKNFSTEDEYLLYIFTQRLYKMRTRSKVYVSAEFLLNKWKSQKGECYYLKKHMALSIDEEKELYGTKNRFNLSVDRVDSSKEYTEDNIVLCCNVINSMKSNLSLEEFKKIVTDLYDNLQ